MNARALLPLLLLLAAFELAAPAFAAAPQAPAERRYPVAERGSGGWPHAAMLQVVRSPDWSDADVYPRASRRLEQEGDVGIDLLVGTNGVPGACRVWLASRYVQLDDSTCDLGMTMRFARLAAPSVYRARLTWRLSDSTRFGAGRLVARLETWSGNVGRCTLAAFGAVPPEWQGFACRILTAEAGHFLGDGLRGPHRATVVLELIPAGATAAADGVPPGRLTAMRRTEFQVDRGGEISNCRAVVNRGFGARTLDYSGPCGLFLSQAWIRRGGGGDAPRGGAFEIRVYVEDQERPGDAAGD